MTHARPDRSDGQLALSAASAMTSEIVKAFAMLGSTVESEDEAFIARYNRLKRAGRI